jgi:dimethylsulfone monooxygenase
MSTIQAAHSQFPRSAELRGANPVFGSNALKIGVFGLNSVGCAQTLDAHAFNPSWERSLAAARQADTAGFDAIVPYARWKSFVPDALHHRSSRVMECFVWSAAVAASTSRAAIFATCHVPVFHPVLAAKQAATIDQIAGGRFGLNVVAGWYRHELTMFGTRLREHHDRYAQAAEWMELVRRVWTEDDLVDHHGEYYEVEGAYMEPKPAQAPHPAIMNAGGSERGRDFAARYADLAFVMFGSDEPDVIAQAVQEYRALARDRYGRELQVWTPAYIVHGETDADAAAEAERLVHNGDYVATDAFIAGMVETKSNLPEDVLNTMRSRIVTGGGGFPLVGSTDSITDRLGLLSAAGVDGVLLSWVRYEEGIDHFAREVAPLLTDRGLREQHEHRTS